MGKSRHPKQMPPTSFDGLCRGSDGVQALWHQCKSAAIVHRHVAPAARGQFSFRFYIFLTSEYLYIVFSVILPPLTSPFHFLLMTLFLNVLN